MSFYKFVLMVQAVINPINNPQTVLNESRNNKTQLRDCGLRIFTNYSRGNMSGFNQLRLSLQRSYLSKTVKCYWPKFFMEFAFTFCFNNFNKYCI